MVGLGVELEYIKS